MDNLEKVVNGLECCFNVQSGWKDAVWVCPACPYAKNDGKPCETLAPLLEDALALLKAQQPRVMTLDEALNTDYVWYEPRSTGLASPASVLKSLNTPLCGGYDAKIQRIGCGESIFMPEKEYCKTWRCWTSRPTDEQRKAVKWDVGSET